MKKLAAILLTACLLIGSLSLFAFAADTEPVDALPAEADEAEDAVVVCASVSDVAMFILVPAVWCEIQIVPAVLETQDGTQDVYFVALRGAGIQMNKANNVIACFLSAFNITNKYYEQVRDAVYQFVPEGSKIVFAGHSLGGMVAQQLSCTDEFTEKYELLNTLNMGSPYVLADASKREGPLVRCVDKYDVIPKLSPAVFADLANYRNAIQKDGGYLGNPDGAHNMSYRSSELWGSYDVFGVENGGAKLTFNAADVTALSV